MPADTLKLLRVGKSLVAKSTIPPVKSAGKSAVKVLATTILSITDVGNKSIWMVLRSGSKPGMSIPFKVVLV